MLKLNPWIYLGVLLFWLASMAAVGAWQNRTGHKVEEAKWLKKENTELVTANAEIVRLTAEATKNKAKHEEALVAISTDYQKEINDVESEKTKFIVGVRNGSIVLRQPARPKSTGESGVSETVASSSGCDGQADTELYPETAEFLSSEAARADKIVLQLDACQQVVIEDRKLCGEKPGTP